MIRFILLSLLLVACEKRACLDKKVYFEHNDLLYPLANDIGGSVACGDRKQHEVWHVFHIPMAVD